MALEGNIKEFGVADILQLVSQQQKTGILLVDKKEEKAEIYFLDGQITETRVSQRKATEPLGEMFVKAKLISADNLKRALDKQKETYGHLGQILLQDGLISKDDLEKAIQTQAYETFYDILQWRDGSYRFVPEKISIDHDVPIPGLESILLDVFRMIDEWPDVKKVITSFDMVFDKIEEKNQAELYPDETLVYSLIDGKNTVQEIINKDLLGRFTTCKILVELLQQGYIKLISAKAEKKVARAGIPFRKAVGLFSYVGLIIILYLLFLLPTRFPESVLPVLNPKYLEKSYLQTYFKNRIIQKLEKALEIFRLQNGGYPESLGELISAGILQDNDLQVDDYSSVTYSKRGDFYTVKVERQK